MDPIIGGALISAGSNLVGQLIGGSDGPDHLSKRTYQANYNSITGKVDAAKAMGISPLYALGAPTMSPSVQTGGGKSLGTTISEMGADVGRAVAAKQTEAERLLQALTLQKAGLENDYLRAQINSINGRTARESAPPLPEHIGFQPPSTDPDVVNPVQKTRHIDAGYSYETNPYVNDAQTFNNRYGEGFLQDLFNLFYIGGADLGWNMTRPTVHRKRYYDRIPPSGSYGRYNYNR